LYQSEGSVAAFASGIEINGITIDSNITAVITIAIKDFFIFHSSLDIALFIDMPDHFKRFSIM
jgi:hypothetical protein